jgi:hypothetical protein
MSANVDVFQLFQYVHGGYVVDRRQVQHNLSRISGINLAPLPQLPTHPHRQSCLLCTRVAFHTSQCMIVEHLKTTAQMVRSRFSATRNNLSKPRRQMADSVQKLAKKLGDDKDNPMVLEAG